MPLYVPEPPTEGLELINTVFEDRLSRPTSTLRAMVNANLNNLTAAAPHHVYFVSLESAASGQMLAQAELTGWRYLVMDDEQPVVAVKLDINPNEGNLEISSINQGPLVDGTLEGVRIAEGLGDVRAEDFELRLLEIPSLYVIALWLHGESKDLFIPLTPNNRELEPFSVYTEPELLTAIRDSASRQLSVIEENV